MSKISWVFLMFMLAGECKAQEYFVFVDAGNRQPFYVRLDSQFFSSSAEGHLILSRLRDSTYTLTIGFPGETNAEQHYTFGIHGKDQAFELRDHGADSPGLFDLQANEWLTARPTEKGPDELHPGGLKKDDAFSRMMAGVVHDTAVLYNTYAVEQAVNDSPASAMTSPTPAAPPVPGDSVTSKPDSSLVPAPAPAPASTSASAPALAPANAPASATVPASASAPATASRDTALASATVPALAAATAPARPDTALASASPLIKPDSSSASPGTGSPADTSARLYRPVAGTRSAPDSTTVLYRPSAGTAAHKAAPIVDSLGKKPLNRRPLGTVVKLSERRSPRIVRLVYADQSRGRKTDTIVVIIPVDSGRAPLTRVHGPNVSADSPAVGQRTGFRSSTPAGNTPAEAPRPAGSPADSQRRPAKPVMPYVNSDCHIFATDLDLDKLRAKMLEVPKDEDRLAIASKAFKMKCFYTKYLRTLSEVFTTDAAKYRFFEAAWPFAADEHFHELSNLFTDPVYSNKFKTLTGHP